MGIFNFFKQTTKANYNHDTKDTRKAECPYCNKALEKIPAKKTKCPHCGQFIIVRTNPENKSRVVVTETEAKKIDRQWSEIQFYKKWIENLEQFNVTEKDFQTKQLALNKKFGHKASTHDVIWGIFNTLIVMTNDPQQLRMINNEMALFLDDEGRNPFPSLFEASRMELLFLQSTGCKKVEIHTTDNQSCKECNNQNGKIYKIENAIKNMPIPCKKCSFKFEPNKKPFCRCMYLTITE